MLIGIVRSYFSVKIMHISQFFYFGNQNCRFDNKIGDVFKENDTISNDSRLFPVFTYVVFYVSLIRESGAVNNY